MSPPSPRPKDWTEEAVWQDVELGSYVADLPLWEELAEEAGGPVLELGAGSGRVTLHLAGAGFEVVAIEADPALAEDLERRVKGLPVRVLAADIASMPTNGTDTSGLRLAIAPLQMIQLLDAGRRRLALEALAGMLAGGARCALTLVDESTLAELGVVAAPRPDMRDVEGWVYSSEPLWVQASNESLRIRRLRERVAPGGELVRRVHDDVLHRLPPDQLEAEAGAAGLRPVERREIPSGTHEAGSIAVILEAG